METPSLPDGALTLDAVTVLSLTGKSHPEEVERLDIIFTPIKEIRQIQTCSNLQELWLMENSLKEIPNLSGVRHCLRVLSLQGQSITKIENLSSMPALRQLYLQCNRITQLENLEGCPKLQRLWVFSNKLQKLDNISCLSDLRELWVQDNFINDISPVAALANLRSLDVSQNEIDDMKQLTHLNQLPALHDVSFASPNFDSCPLADEDSYRDLVIFHLKQIRVLDGSPVNDKDRASVEEMYLKSVLEFNDKIDELKRENHSMLESIERRKRRNDRNANEMKKQLNDGLGKLCKTVEEGRSKLVDEHFRQRRLRDEGRRMLENIFTTIKSEYETEVSKFIEQETANMENEKQFHQILRERILKQCDEEVFLSSLPSLTEGRVVGYEVDFSHPEAVLIKDEVDNCLSFELDRNNIISNETVAMFRVACPEVEETFSKIPRTHAKQEATLVRRFLAGNLDTLQHYLVKGFDINKYKPLRVFETPSDALQVLDVTSPTNAVSLLALRVWLVGEGPMDVRSLDPTPELDGRFKWGRHTDDMGLVSDLIFDPSTILPYLYLSLRPKLRTQNGSVRDDVVRDHFYRNDVLLDEGNAYASLRQLERQVDDEFRRFEHVVWFEVDPEVTKNARDKDEDIRRLQLMYEQIQEHITAERENQDALLREFRGQVYQSQPNQLPASSSAKRPGSTRARPASQPAGPANTPNQLGPNRPYSQGGPSHHEMSRSESRMESKRRSLHKTSTAFM